MKNKINIRPFIDAVGRAGGMADIERTHSETVYVVVTEGRDRARRYRFSRHWAAQGDFNYNAYAHNGDKPKSPPDGFNGFIGGAVLDMEKWIKTREK